MKNKLAKSMSMIIAIAMLISMVPAMASGTASIAIKDVDIVDGTVTVTYDAAGLSEFTLLAVRDTSAYVSAEDLPTGDADLEKQIEYIDQPTLSGNVTDATFTFKLRDRSAEGLAMADAQYVNVLLGGEGVATPAVDNYKEKLAAPKIEDPATLTVFSDEDIVFTVPTGTAAWATGAAVYVNGATEPYADALAADGQSITINSDVNVTAIRVENADYNDATWAGVITVKDREATAAAAVGGATVVYDVDNDSDDVLEGTAKITIPDDATHAETGVEIAYKLTKDGVDQTLTGDTGRFIVVNRPAIDSPADEYKLVATLTYNGTPYGTPVEKTFSVNAIGADGPTFEASNVEVVGTDVYNMAGKSVVIVKHEDVDAENTSIVVDGVKLYYFPVRGTHVGVINTTTVDALISGNKISTLNEAPVALYSGVALESSVASKLPTANDGTLAARFGAGLSEIVPSQLASMWKLLGETNDDYDATAWLLSCDVVGAFDLASATFAAEMDGKLTSNDAVFVKRVGAGKDNRQFAIDLAE